MAGSAMAGDHVGARLTVVIAGLTGGLGCLLVVYRLLRHHEMTEVLVSLFPRRSDRS